MWIIGLQFSLWFLGHSRWLRATAYLFTLLICVEVLQPSQPNICVCVCVWEGGGGMGGGVISLPNHTFTGQA